MKKLILMTAWLSLNAYGAGNEVGNGGDIVLCENDGQEMAKPLVLDYYERKEGDFTLKEIEKDDEYQIAKSVFSRLKRIAPTLEEKYQRDLEKFRLKVKFKTGEEFRDIEDSYHVSIKKGCELKQIAHQRKNKLTKDTEVFINKDLYEKLDAYQKAMLITHEIIYEHFLYFNVLSSVKVRLFNRYLFSEEIKGHKKKDFNKIGESLAIPLY